MNAVVYAPSGGGKTVNTTLVKGKRNLLINSDNSHVSLNNFKRDNLDIVVTSHWLNKDIKGNVQDNFLDQLESAIESKKYDNIIIDNISDIFDMAILEYADHGVIKDARQHYQLVYQALKRLARRAAQVDCNIIFTAWTDIQEITLPTGERVQRMQPKLPMKILDNFLGLTQIVAYVTTAMKGDEKKWYYALEGSPTLIAKDQAFNRKSCMPEDIFTGGK